MTKFVSQTTRVRSFDSREFRLADLVARKRDGDVRIAVCLPARDEEATVGDVVAAIPDELVDEIVVIDDGSGDRTAAVAAAAGARVVSIEGAGKGAAMRRGLEETTGDLVVYLDADVRNFEQHFVTGLVGPLLEHDDLALVKAFYLRPTADGPEGGGRVTELVAKPLLRLLFPELASLRQPLAGEVAARRTLLEKIDFAEGYAVDLALLLDAVNVAGIDSLAEVDLGARVHRNRPLSQLAPQAEEIIAMALERAQAQRK
jgi:glucosyl-3-phosphoglycerate synthase